MVGDPRTKQLTDFSLRRGLPAGVVEMGLGSGAALGEPASSAPSPGLNISSDGAGPPCAARGWAFLGLAEIANFDAIRRDVGRLRARQLLSEVVRLLRVALPKAQVHVIGRATMEMAFGGDALADAEDAVGLLSGLFDQPVDVGGASLEVAMIFAVAAAPIGHTDDVRLIEEAEAAMEQARIDQRSIIRDLSAGTPAFDKLTLSRELADGIANREMFLQYQPKVHVRRREIASAEALVRWQHPTRGLVMPGDFIPLAEEIRQIGALTLWTLERVIADQKIIAGDGHDLTIFINISGQLLADTAFVEQACAMVRDGGAKIGFEITETSVIRDPQVAIAHLQVIADVGITIAIDDYGAGLSSLAYLKQLPARELKIDKLFVMQLTSSHRDPLIVRSTIDLAHALEMEVTAEGVETQAALALLTVMGCDMVQGYLISRPISIDAFRQYLREDQFALRDEKSQSMFSRPPSFWKSA